MAPISETLQTLAFGALMRVPLSWATYLSGPTRTVEGQTLDTRTRWLLTLVARSGRPPLHELARSQTWTACRAPSSLEPSPRPATRWRN